jgi:hypothetical protein
MPVDIIKFNKLLELNILKIFNFQVLYRIYGIGFHLRKGKIILTESSFS